MLLDCPPSLGLLTLNALAVAGEVIIPMQPHFLALQGVAKLLETVHLVSRKLNNRLRVTGVVLTMFDSQTKLSMEVVNELNGFIMDALGKPLPWSSAKVFDTRVRRNIKLAESPSFGKTIIEYDPSSNGAADYRALARELLGVKDAPVAAAAAKPAASGTASKAKAVPPPAAAVKPAALPPPAAPPAPVARPTVTSPPMVAKATTPAVSAPAARPVPAPAAKPVASARPAGPPPQRTGPIRPVPPVSMQVQPVDPSKLAAAKASPPPSAPATVRPVPAAPPPPPSTDQKEEISV
jgi:hypothetical protein